MNPLLSDFSSLSNINPIILGIVLVWSLIWKGLALWKSAKKDSKIWFVALLVINTVGILEILYFYLFSKMDVTKKEVRIKSKTGKKVSKSRK